MPARHLVLGLDGADLALVRELGADRMPNLHAAMAAGAYSAQRSVLPAATLPNWTTFLTGVDPGTHGVFDFTMREGTSLRFVGGAVRDTATVFARLDALGLRTAVLFFPATYPPERLEHGIFISGWDSPVAFRADATFVHPRALHAALVARFGELRFDDVDEFDADRPGWHAALAPALGQRIARKVSLARHLLERDTFDVFALYFGELDTASHHLRAHFDPRSPRHPGPTNASSGLADVHVAIDAAIGTLLECAGGQGVEITIVSDHGTAGTSDRVVYVNRALHDAGLLAFRPVRAHHRVLSVLKGLALTRLPPALRERAFRFAGNLLPSWLESRSRYGAIDFERTSAFSDELSYFPSVSLAPTVRAHARDEVLRRVEQALRALRSPLDGARLVRAVHRREELFRGPHVSRCPDLVLELEPDGDYVKNLAKSHGPGPVEARLSPSDYIGRKGTSLPGGHRDRGLFVAAGPSVLPVGELDSFIADATATLLARLGVAVPEGFAGRVLFEALAFDEAARSLPEATITRGDAHYDEASVERRLRALGYLE